MGDEQDGARLARPARPPASPASRARVSASSARERLVEAEDRLAGQQRAQRRRRAGACPPESSCGRARSKPAEAEARAAAAARASRASRARRAGARAGRARRCRARSSHGSSRSRWGMSTAGSRVDPAGVGRAAGRRRARAASTCRSRSGPTTATTSPAAARRLTSSSAGPRRRRDGAGRPGARRSGAPRPRRLRSRPDAGLGAHRHHAPSAGITPQVRRVEPASWTPLSRAKPPAPLFSDAGHRSTTPGARRPVRALARVRPGDPLLRDEAGARGGLLDERPPARRAGRVVHDDRRDGHPAAQREQRRRRGARGRRGSPRCRAARSRPAAPDRRSASTAGGGTSACSEAMTVTLTRASGGVPAGGSARRGDRRAPSRRRTRTRSSVATGAGQQRGQLGQGRPQRARRRRR